MKLKQSRNRIRGKDSERKVAKMLNGRRVGILGEEDVLHPQFSIEVKSRKKFVAKNWMEQAKKNNKEDKIPLVVVHESGTPHKKDLVIININDLKKISEFLK